MMSMRQKTLLGRTQSGFTLIELVIVILILGILLTVVATTWRGVQARNRNSSRETNITTIQGALELYYAQTSTYPTLNELNTPSWVQAHLRDVTTRLLKDPGWASSVKACTSGGQSVLISHPAIDCYGYQPIASDGSACDNNKKICAHYTLTAELEGGGKFAKSSLN